jgi:L-malate glycosyltransferase
MTPVRVAHVVHGTHMGGAERRLLRLMLSLDRDRFDSRIVCIDDLGEFSVAARELGFAPLLARRSSRRDVRVVFRLARLFSREGISIVEGWLPLPAVVARAAAVLARVPARIYVEGQTVPTPDPRRARRNALLERVLAPFTSAYVANSEAVARTLRQELALKPSKIVVIHNGVALPTPVDADERAQLRAELGATADDQLIGMTARLDPRYKDHRTFLSAVALLAAEGRPIRAVVVGDGPARAELEQFAAELAIGQRVTFTGFLDNAARLCQVFDVSVLLSHSEGFSNAVLETMAAGSPLVATAIAPNREAVQDQVHGLLVPPQDAGAAAAAVGRILDDRRLARCLGLAARERVVTRFSLEAQADATMRLYAQLLRGRGGRAAT